MCKKKSDFCSPRRATADIAAHVNTHLSLSVSLSVSLHDCILSCTHPPPLLAFYEGNWISGDGAGLVDVA